MAKTLRIFISSPSDVADERRRAALVIKRLNREFARFFDLEAILWEREAMRASGHFQDILVPPSATDIVVVILCARLGTPLPDRTAVRHYRGLDGRSPVTGTGWEFEDALRANREGGVPELLVYRKPAAAAAVTIQADRLDEAKAQLLALEAFWRRYFIDDCGGFKAAFNRFDTLDGFEEQLEQHLRQLLQSRLPRLTAQSEPAETEIAWHQGSPFRGLQVFEAAHEKIFFGRARAEQAVIEALVRQASVGTAFVLVLGASGSGKSSLVRAGVVPQLMAPGVVSGIEVWRSCIFKPSEATGDLVAALAQALIEQGNALPELPAAGIDLPDVITQLRAAAVLPLKLGLRQAALAMPRPAGAPVPEARLVLVIDQLEEVFTLNEITPEQRADFVALLTALAKSGVVWVLATLRSDLYHRCAELPELVDLAAGEGQYHLTTPRPAELDQMIRLPAAAAGIGFATHPETGIALNAVLLEAAARDPAALPLLEFTLDELYHQDIEARPGQLLTYDSYTALDGLEGAIAARADVVCWDLPPAQVSALPGLLRALVTVGEDSDLATARAVPHADLATTPARTALLDTLVRERLLVAGDDRVGPVVRLTHEALLSHWPLLKELVNKDRKFLRVRARLQADRARWQAEGHSHDLLLPSGKRLEEAKEVLRARRDEMDAATAAFIERSIERDRQIHQRSLRRTRAVAAGMAVLALSAAGFGWYSYDRSIQAERNFDHAVKASDALVTEVAARLKPLAGISGVSTDILYEILTNAEQRFGELTAIEPDSPYLQDRRAAMLRAFAEIYAALGNTAEQMNRAQEARHITERLLTQDPTNTTWQRNLAISYGMVGDALMEQGNLTDALAAYGACKSIAEQLVTSDSSNLDWQDIIANTHLKIGRVFLSQGRLDDAVNTVFTSQQIFEYLVNQDQNKPKWQDGLETAKQVLSIFHDVNSNTSDSLENLKDSRAVLEHLVERDPSNVSWQISLAQNQNMIGITLQRERDLDGALAAFQGYQTTMEHLVNRDQSNVEWKNMLATSYLQIGTTLEYQGDFNSALKEYQNYNSIMKRLTGQNPGNDEWQERLAQSYARVADVQRARGDFSEALARYQDAEKIIKPLIARDPSNTSLEDSLATLYIDIGIALKSQGNFIAAVEAYRAAEAHTENHITQNHNSDRALHRLAIIYMNIAGVLENQGDLIGALESSRAYQATMERLATQDPSKAQWQSELALSYRTVGDALHNQGDLSGALAAYRTALAVNERLAVQDPDNVYWQQNRVLNYRMIGNVLKHQGDLTGALTAYQAALANDQHLAAHGSDKLKWQAELAVDYQAVGDVLKTQGDLTDALTNFRTALVISEHLVAQAPDSDEWQYKLAVYHKVIGDVLKMQGNYIDALAAYHTAQMILERVLAQQPSPASSQADLAGRNLTIGEVLEFQADMASMRTGYRAFSQAMYYLTLGEVLQAQGNLADALMANRAAQPFIERLVSQNPENRLWHYGLMLIYKQIGNVLHVRGEFGDALEVYHAALANIEYISGQATGNVESKTALADILLRLAEVSSYLGQHESAIQYGEQSLALIKSNQNGGTVIQSELATALGKMSRVYLNNCQFDKAKVTAQEGYSLDSKQISILVNFAHAQMFLGYMEAAMDLHLQHADDVIMLGDSSKTWREATLDDFSAFRKAGLESPHMAAIENLLLKGSRK